MRKTIFLLLIIIFFANLFYRVYSNKDAYLSSFNGEYWKNRYLESQWVVPNSKKPIGDDGLFTYTAWEYIHGEDPRFLVPEYPPLGKYLLGASILLFNNQNIFALLVGLSVLAVFYVFNLNLFKDKLIAFIPVFLFSLEPIFYGQIKAPYFDTLYLLFFLLSFLFFYKKKYFLSSIFLGCFASVKYSPQVILVILTMVSYLLLQKNYKEIKKYLITLPIVPIVFLLFYFRFFMLGHGIKEFLGFQKWIMNFYLIGAKGKIFSIFPFFLWGDWYTWWTGILRVAEWNILWPLSFLSSVVYFIFLVIRKEFSNKLTFLFIWIFFYFIFLIFIPIWPRYLLLAIPFMYNLAVWVFLKGIMPKLQLL